MIYIYTFIKLYALQHNVKGNVLIFLQCKRTINNVICI